MGSKGTIFSHESELLTIAYDHTAKNSPIFLKKKVKTKNSGTLKRIKMSSAMFLMLIQSLGRSYLQDQSDRMTD